MLRKLNRKKKGQNTAEYAILISLVVAAVIAMQTYVQRGLQAKMRDAVKDYMVNKIDAAGLGGNTVQYEPYYLERSYNVYRDTSQTVVMGNGITGQFSYGNTIRLDGGYEATTYNTELGNTGDMKKDL